MLVVVPTWIAVVIVIMLVVLMTIVGGTIYALRQFGALRFRQDGDC